MTTASPGDDTGELAGWKAVLLARIQQRSFDHARVLYRGYPDYDPATGRGDTAIATWRAHLLDLQAEQHELIVRAAASGVPEAMITAAIDNGTQGRRWGESVRNPPTTRYGEDPVRAQMIAQIAEDVWSLEHMAAIGVDRERRGGGDRADRAAHEQYLRNMDALWQRTDLTAAVAHLSVAERSELWGRDAAGWRRLVEVSVAGYDDADLEQLWRAHAWPGVEWDVNRTSENLAGEAEAFSTPDRHRPPTPTVLFERARAALDDIGATELAAPGIDHALDAALLPPSRAAPSAGGEPTESSFDIDATTEPEVEL
ncbi:hypothetical protein [Nocardia shimofusensis]|uniref:hypothetical protein n=1 Tax=Nocardia shimofusensis TaxID=228596 RepID=UPI00082F815C|nr:hypothetical protein [Nocardia shimofusensis]